MNTCPVTKIGDLIEIYIQNTVYKSLLISGFIKINKNITVAL